MIKQTNEPLPPKTGRVDQGEYSTTQHHAHRPYAAFPLAHCIVVVPALGLKGCQDREHYAGDHVVAAGVEPNCELHWLLLE